MPVVIEDSNRNEYLENERRIVKRKAQGKWKNFSYRSRDFFNKAQLFYVKAIKTKLAGAGAPLLTQNQNDFISGATPLFRLSLPKSNDITCYARRQARR